jgi:hypothetical protein
MDGRIRYIEKGEIPELAEKREIRANVIREAVETGISRVYIRKGDRRRE